MPAAKSPFEFPAELQATADLCARLRARLETDMDRGLKGGDDNSKAPLKEHAAMLRELATATVTLGKEVRAWSGHTRTQLDTMSPAKKAQVVLRFVQDLPLSGRRDFYEVLSRLEADRPDGLTLQLTDRFAGSHV